MCSLSQCAFDDKQDYRYNPCAVERFMAVFWNWIWEPMLFVTIGASIDFATLDASIIPRSLIIICTGAAGNRGETKGWNFTKGPWTRLVRPCLWGHHPAVARHLQRRVPECAIVYVQSLWRTRVVVRVTSWCSSPALAIGLPSMPAPDRQACGGASLVLLFCLVAHPIHPHPPCTHRRRVPAPDRHVCGDDRLWLHRQGAPVLRAGLDAQGHRAGSALRCVPCFCLVRGRVLCSLAWTPKATVQAALSFPPHTGATLAGAGPRTSATRPPAPHHQPSHTSKRP